MCLLLQTRHSAKSTTAHQLKLSRLPPPPSLSFEQKRSMPELATWPEVIPFSWNPIRVYAHAIPQDVIDAGLYGDSGDIYPDIISCSTWNDWRVARLKILALIARLDHGDSSIQAVATIQQLVDDTCASVPFSLGSRIKPATMYAADTSYPCAEGQAATKRHLQTAAALGGPYLFSQFKEVLNVAAYLRKRPASLDPWTIDATRPNL